MSGFFQLKEIRHLENCLTLKEKEKEGNLKKIYTPCF